MKESNSIDLDQLLAQLNANLTKSAADDCDGEKKEDKSEKDEGEKDEKKMPSWLKDKGDSKSEDKKDEDEKKEDEGSEKKASLTPTEAGASLYNEIMQKIASQNLNDTPTEQPQMNKQAQVAGKALASALLDSLQKKANAGDMTLMDGNAAPGTVNNKVHNDVAQTVVEQEAATKPMLTGDGIKNTGTINQIFDAIVQDAISQGAASEEQVHQTGVSTQEGNAESGVPNQVKVASEQEKVAAVHALVTEGLNWEDAVALVKQAEAEINLELEKSAAMQALIAEGVDFDSAVELVKQASAGDMTVETAGAAPGTVPNKVQADTAQAAAESDANVKPMLTGDGIKNTGSINQIFDAIVQDAQGQGAAGEDQVHQSGVSAQEGGAESGVPNQVKVAFMNALIEKGVDFDAAAKFVADMQKSAGAMVPVKPSTAVGKSMVMKPKAGLGKKLAIGAGVAGLVGAAGVAAMSSGKEKKAAFDALIEAGVDFEKAAQLVADKARELYGE